MMETNNESVYNLITSLCEQFSISRDKIKTNRSHCYELLLKKRLFEDPRKFKDLEGTDNPVHKMEAWCYQLTHEHDFGETAKDLQKHTEQLKQSYKEDTDSFNNILTFLLCLKDIPTKQKRNVLDLYSLPEIEENTVMSRFDEMFKMPHYLIEEFESPIFSKMSQELLEIQPIESKTESETLEADEEHSCPNLQKNIWEIASKQPVSKRRNWESYGCGIPDKEKPFLSELGELSSLWVENLDSLYLTRNAFPSFNYMSNKFKTRKSFVQDLKYLLVGIVSETFMTNSKEEFVITPGIMVEGLTTDVIERYCSSFLFSGTCYRALNKLATKDPLTRNYKHPGYVFSEFCEAVAKYLRYYRTAIFSLSEDILYLSFREKTLKIQNQIATLALICKIGPCASENEETPHGVPLLNYLYQKVLMGASDKTLCLVLYSIFYPCCQVYFSRFLHQWIVKGILNDPYQEFFIRSNLKYLSSRGRTYWTRSYETREDMIPDFLIDLKQDILYCGRIMNLLRLCDPSHKLCRFVMGKNQLMLTSCLSHEKLTQLQQTCSRYYLEASAECGTKFSFEKYLEKSKGTDITLLYAKKRAVTLRRIELERQKAKQEAHEKKLEEMLMLKEQLDLILEQKQHKIYQEIRKEIQTMEENVRIEEMREKLVEQEASKMIEYYTELCQAVDNRKAKIVKHIKTNTTIYIEDSPEKSKSKANSSSESFFSVTSTTEDIMETSGIEKDNVIEEQNNEKEEIRPVHSSESMDLLNANVESSNINMQATMDNFELARKIKQKVLNQELGIEVDDWHNKYQEKAKSTLGSTEAQRNKSKVLNQEFGIIVDDWHNKQQDQIKQTTTTVGLSAAQRNKLKVLSSEFGIELRENVRTDGTLTMAQINRDRVMGHNECFLPNYDGKRLDNESFVNRNLREITTRTDDKTESRETSHQMPKSKSLQLDFDKLNSKFDLDKPVPMSVDSTPMSDLPLTGTPTSDFPRSATPSSSMFLSVDTKFDSDPATTADTHRTEDVFSFGAIPKSSGNINQKLQNSEAMPTFSKKPSLEEIQEISRISIGVHLHESVSIPLLTQLRLGNNELLKYFVEELNFLKHLISLRDYFFLQDGEFARNLTEQLFEKLYSANFPLELINCKTLHHLVFDALDNSSKHQDNSKYLSFKINSLPKCFDLGDPDVLNCLSMTYKVEWPLNIFLPSDAVSKYNQVFKFLVKINRVSWVLKKIFLEFKVLARETGKKEIYLMSSPQYKHLHQCRHVMLHFVQSLQNYIVGEVLQPSWAYFEQNFATLTKIDDLYYAHTAYIKDIITKCMLSQRSILLKNIIDKIFVVVLKFYDYLRPRSWKCEDGAYVHPNFNKLDKIFKNFEEFVVYFFKVVKKFGNSGFYPQLVQFLDVLDYNGFYSKKLLNNPKNVNMAA
ncbi:unnamed protein product [Ceutorhynchus assimilis]|uniref:Gamma-tubulin complex component 6 n=1 Tax=Ceutorhynchus assimilis TaxID=467358 RepID=A0A9N9MXV8_9CUCU|nr:unnamed protein product [Ceutorhynchus assimilis]